MGIAVYPEDGQTIEDLVKNADVAMYHAKESGRNTCRLYSPTMNSEAMGRMRLDQQLRRAVDTGQFAMVYQPIVNTRTGTVVGAEALVRWNHPDRGLLSPGEFIALTEESGLIVRLGEWILRTVCAQGKIWADQGLGSLRLSVNLSGRQLQRPDIVDLIWEILKETKLSPRSLVLELTESVVMQPDSPVAASIRALAKLGVKFAIDDFGTGYSSLSYLKHFPVDALKIDQSFIKDLLTDPDDAAITSAVIALGKALGIAVVAEGVETEEQAVYLAQNGCDQIQGYFVGQPMPPEEFAASLPVLGDRLRAGLLADVSS
jgi:EAL domain-containing protein (putative c-di-GMP-specific phosphodiesterase class I)